MTLNISKWLWISQNDTEWLKMTCNGSIWHGILKWFYLSYRMIWKVWPLKNKPTVPIKCTVTKILQMSLSNIPYEPRNFWFNTQSYRTYNRQLRVSWKGILTVFYRSGKAVAQWTELVNLVWKFIFWQFLNLGKIFGLIPRIYTIF